MSSNARIFFAGVGTTFAILAVGFGAGLMMASSTLPDTAGRAGSTSERLGPVQRLHHSDPAVVSIRSGKVVSASLPCAPGAPGSLAGFFNLDQVFI